MAFQAITTNQSSTYQIQDYDYFVLMPGIYVQSSSDGFDGNPGIDAQMTGARLTVLGTIAAGDTGVDFFYSPDIAMQVSVVIGSDGAIHAGLGGVAMDAGNGNSIINYGEVGSGGYTLYMGGGGTGNRVENHGVLSLTGTATKSAIWVGEGSSPVFLVNSGIITGQPGTGRALVESLAPLSFSNSGQISALGAIALQGAVDHADTVTNSGLIEGRVQLGDGADRVFNTGDIIGAVDLGEADDFYRALGQGVASDSVLGAQGNDTLIGGDQGDLFDGGEGDDLLRGQAGNDGLSGSSGADTILGGVGNDTLAGGNDDDRLLGENGDDSINGGNGADDIFGGNDDDTLLGGDGEDRLFGGAGQNDLYGQGGRDVIYAQAGEDTIIFQSASDSAVGINRDVVRGFDLGQDVIDLVSVAPGVLTFAGSSPFSGTAREVRVVELSTGSSLVQVDVDGDGIRDMELLVEQVWGLSETDFVL